MTKIWKTALLGTILGVALVSGANAQTATRLTKDADGLSVDAVVITSGTTLRAQPVRDVRGSLIVYLSATTPVSVSVQRLLSNGTQLSAGTIAVDTGGTSLTINAPVPFQAVRLSPTTALSGVNALHGILFNAKD